METRAWWKACLLVTAAAGILAGALSGCGVLDALNLQRPSAKVAGVSLRELGLQAATLQFDIDVGNPYAVPLPLANIDYGLASQGQVFLSGKADLQGTIPAKGHKTISVPARVNYAELLKTIQGIRPGSVLPYQAELGLSVDAPGVGPLRLPLKQQGQLPVPALPDVSVSEIKWSKLTMDEAGGVVKLNLTNRNEFPMDLKKLAYGLSLGGTRVGSGSITQAASFKAGGSSVLEIPLSFPPAKAGLALFKSLLGKSGGYGFQGNLEVSTPFGALAIPLEKTGQTVFSK